MIIYPAIDIKDGSCVRLRQGRKDDATLYCSQPSQMAKKWLDCGAQYLHVVDLDGAFDGKSKNIQAICDIIKNTKGTPVQVGGGIRSMQAIENMLTLGVARVILGTAAIANPDFVKEAAKAFPARVIVSIDAKNGAVAIGGWVEQTNINAVELACRLRDMGVFCCVYTDIAKDGMMSGPNLEATYEMHRKSGIDIIASGGVSKLSDIEALSEAKIHGAIIGKALYDGTLELEAAIALAKK